MDLKSFFNFISPLSSQTWKEIEPFFHRKRLAQNEHFINVNDTAIEIAFLESGIVRAYFLNKEGKGIFTYVALLSFIDDIVILPMLLKHSCLCVSNYRCKHINTGMREDDLVGW